MDQAHLFAIGVLLAWLAGIRVYLTVFGVGIAGFFGWLPLPEALQATRRFPCRRRRWQPADGPHRPPARTPRHPASRSHRPCSPPPAPSTPPIPTGS